MAILLDGQKIASAMKAEMKKEIAELEKKFQRRPALACLSVGENPAVCVYCKAQSKVAEELGIAYRIVTLPDDTEENDLIAQISRCNSDDSLDGFMLQTPLPKGLRRELVMEFIAPEKDAEGVHPQHLGRLVLGQECRVAPCTALASFELIKETGMDLRGKEAVVVGHSEIVGKPLALMLLKEYATTTVCHIATAEAHQLESHVRRADVVIAAVGKPHVIKGAWIKEGAVVIDVGISRMQDHIVGDVEFDAASVRASYITPVPGGVGPVTVAMLMRNVVALYKAKMGN